MDDQRSWGCRHYQPGLEVTGRCLLCGLPRSEHVGEIAAIAGEFLNWHAGRRSQGAEAAVLGWVVRASHRGLGRRGLLARLGGILSNEQLDGAVKRLAKRHWIVKNATGKCWISAPQITICYEWFGH